MLQKTINDTNIKSNEKEVNAEYKTKISQENLKTIDDEKRFFLRLCEKISVNSKTVIKTLLLERL